jgi:hypothetical protein
MRSTLFAIALLAGMPALAARDAGETSCTIKLDSTFQLLAPPGWRFSECTSADRGQEPIFTLEPLNPAFLPRTRLDPHALRMYGGPAGRGTAEFALAADREFYATEFAPNDGDGLRTADRRDVRVLQFTHHGRPFTWVAHGLIKVGPGVFWLAFDCEREDVCASNYSAFKILVGRMRVLRPNELTDR